VSSNKECKFDTGGAAHRGPPYLLLESLLRAIYIGLIVLTAATRFLIRKKVFRRTEKADLAKQLRWIAVKVGGAWAKLGQILATRHDLFEPEAIAILAELQDKMAPIPFDKINDVLLRSLPSTLLQLENIAKTPLATGSIAQIHLAESRKIGRLALKIKKPRTEKLIFLDIMIAKAMAKIVSKLPLSRQLPVVETMDLVCDAVWKQTDFSLEVSNTKRLQLCFSASPNVRFVRVYPELSSNEVIVMEYEEGLHRLDEISVPLLDHHRIIEVSLEAIYEMFFYHGLVHCDVHAGNVLYRKSGEVVFVDCGLVVTVNKNDREDFIDFFLCISLNRGDRAADLILRKALHVPKDINIAKFRNAISSLIASVSGLTAKDFSVGEFVRTLFKIQKAFGVRGSADFTWMALVLLTFEGVVRGRHPEIDFQRIAMNLVVARRARNAGDSINPVT
jgi:ubiquinone biosynthesis protein